MQQWILLLLACGINSTAASGQDVQISRQNKTIAVTAEDSIAADPEVAILAIGYHNYAATHADAFRENVRVSNAITQAILHSGVPKANIETQGLALDRVEPEEKLPPELRKQRQFKAGQSWHIHVPVAQAQAVVDLAVRAGANEVEDVEWNVADPVALQAKANAAALAKARAIAEQMAKALGTKLNELVYASNRAPAPAFLRHLQSVQTQMAMVSAAREEKEPALTLFPKKVKMNATVYAVFAIE